MSKTYQTDSKTAEILDKATKEIEALNMGLKIVSYEYFDGEFKLFAGKVLTIVDASIAESKQNKCIKDLIKSEYYRMIERNNNFYGRTGYGSTIGISDDNNLI